MSKRGCKEHLISAEYARTLLAYEPGTGIITWIVQRGRLRDAVTDELRREVGVG